VTRTQASGVLATVDVDLGALRRNVARLRELARPAQFMAVVKANAYGHGLTRVAQALEGHADALGVYRADEALTLREAGITAPVLVLGPVESADLDALHARSVAVPLWDVRGFRSDVARVARAHGRPFAVHVKVETGVARLGLPPAHAAGAIAEILDDAALQLGGVFTHLAAVEELESAFTLTQLERFEGAIGPVAAALRVRGTKLHAAASAAIMLFPRARLDLVRAGIAIYGLWPSAATRTALHRPFDLEPALSWHTTLVVVRDVPAGTPVGYGCTYETTRPSRIGVLPIGYAEGIPRAVSNRGAVLVGGRRAPIIGRVCMNMTMVDVTDVPEVHPGQAVTLIGRDGDERIGADDWAEWAGTIGYEIVARLPAEVRRTYTGV
jgi:alanine racemase